MTPMVLLNPMFTFIERNLIVNKLDLWQRWVVANALGELVGLGATFSIGFLAFSDGRTAFRRRGSAACRRNGSDGRD